MVNQPALILASLVITIAFTTGFSQAGATSLYQEKGITITLEKSLQISGKLNYTSLKKYDSSDERLSGKFVKVGNDIKRTTNKHQNTYGPYEFDKKYRVFVDPPPAILNKLPGIILVSNLDNYQLKSQMNVTEIKSGDYGTGRTVRITSVIRYTNPGCTLSTLDWKDWQRTIPDTINFMKSGCDPKATKLDTIQKDYVTNKQHDIATTSKYKLEQWKKSLDQCIKTGKNCNIQNRAVTTMGDTR